MCLDISLSFSDPKFLNPNWARYEPKNHICFTRILTIDSNRSESEKNRSELETENLQSLIGSKCL